MKAGWPVLASSLLLSTALGELVLARHDARVAPSAADYANLREPILRLRGKDEPVVVAPRWAEPWVRQSIGDTAMPIRLLARPDDTNVASALVVAALGERPVAMAAWTVEPLETIAGMELIRYRNPSYRELTYDFVRDLGPSNVKVTLSGAPCPYRDNAPRSSGGLGGHPTFAASRFQCAGGDYFHVGETTIADEAFLPRRCLWAHPPSRGQLSIRYGDVALGSRLVGHGGMYWITERERTGAAVQLTVSVDGAEVGRAFHADGDGWASFDFPLGKHAHKPRATVEWRVSSADNRHRHFCFEARSQ